jgi:hypothetical protein
VLRGVNHLLANCSAGFLRLKVARGASVGESLLKVAWPPSAVNG